MRQSVDESCIILEPDYKRITDAKQLDDDGVIALCKEFILLMREDYQRSVNYMETHHIVDAPRYVQAEKTKREIERFTHSKLFNLMFDINRYKFLEMLLEPDEEEEVVEPAG